MKKKTTKQLEESLKHQGDFVRACQEDFARFVYLNGRFPAKDEKIPHTEIDKWQNLKTYGNHV
jgi:hypothetical protein